MNICQIMKAYNSIELAQNELENSSDSEDNVFINKIGIYELNLKDLYFSTLMNISEKYMHNFKRNKGLDSNPCFICKWHPVRN